LAMAASCAVRLTSSIERIQNFETDFLRNKIGEISIINCSKHLIVRKERKEESTKEKE
jgi:hypothetical protein